MHKHLDQIYSCIDDMVPRLGRYERINQWEAAKNKIDMKAIKMNNEIVIGVRRQMKIIAGRKQRTVNMTEKKEDGEDNEE